MTTLSPDAALRRIGLKLTQQIGARVAAGAFVLACLSAPGQASILTFDTCGGSATAAITTTCSGGSLNTNYGNRVSGANTDANGSQDRFYGESGEGYTPNIAVGYSSGGFGWGIGFSNLTNVVWVDGNLGILNITFTADPGFRARLLGFDLGAFPDFINSAIDTYDDVAVSVSDENSSVLFNNSGNFYTVGPEGINQIINVASGNGGSLTLSLDLSRLAFGSGVFDRESVGIDNIRFAQEAVNPDPPPTGNVPEPSTFALVGGAALAGAWLRRR